MCVGETAVFGRPPLQEYTLEPGANQKLQFAQESLLSLELLLEGRRLQSLNPGNPNSNLLQALVLQTTQLPKI